MLLKIREKMTGWVAFVIVGILIIPFAFFGVNNYFESRVATWVAKIEVSPGILGFGGETREISQDEFRSRFDQYRQQARQVLGDAYDARSFDTLEVRRELLDSILEQEMLLIAAREDGIVVTDARVAREIASTPDFQVGGVFDRDQYLLLLRSVGFTPTGYEQRVKQDLLRQVLANQVARSSFVTDADVEAFLRLRSQRRSFEYLAIRPPAIDEEIGEDQLQAWYADNAQRFQSPETVSFEYLVADAGTLQVAQAPDERSLRDRYEEQRARFVEAEQRRAAHILLEVGRNASAEQETAVRARALELAAKAREGEDFAALAREHSDDIGSSGDGGELGWIEEDGMLDPEFERALFALSAEAPISDPVRSSDGWHVIRLLEVREGAVQGFDEVRDELAREWREAERERAYSDLGGRLLEQTFRDPNDLGPAAEALGLELGRRGPVTREDEDGILAYPAVRAQLFEPDFIEQQVASNLIEAEPGRISVVLRVTEHVPPRPRPLDEVREEAMEAVLAERREAAVEALAQELLQRARAGEALAALAEEAGGEAVQVEDVERMSGNHDTALLEAVFALARPAEGEASFGVVALGGEARVLVALTGVADGDLSEINDALRGLVRTQLGRAQGAIEARAYVDALKQRYRVSIAEERL